MLLKFNKNNIDFYHIIMKICYLFDNWKDDMIINDRKRKISSILDTELRVEPEHGYIFVNRYLESIIRYYMENSMISIVSKYDESIWFPEQNNTYQIVSIFIGIGMDRYNVEIDLREDYTSAFKINSLNVNPLMVEFKK